MINVPFIGQSYALQSIAAACQRTLNMYPEPYEDKMPRSGEVAMLVNTPGLKAGASPSPTSATPARGVYKSTKKFAFFAYGNRCARSRICWRHR